MLQQIQSLETVRRQPVKVHNAWLNRFEFVREINTVELLVAVVAVTDADGFAFHLRLFGYFAP